jgi:hypothetical protein
MPDVLEEGICEDDLPIAEDSPDQGMGLRCGPQACIWPLACHMASGARGFFMGMPCIGMEGQGGWLWVGFAWGVPSPIVF